MRLMDLATYASKEKKKLQKKANEFYKRARDARKNMFLCPGPAEEPSTIEDDANTTEAKGKGKGGYMSTIEGDANTTEAKDKGKGAAPSPASAMGKYHNLRKAHLGGVHSPIGQMPIDFDSEAECAYFLMGYGEPHAQPKHSPLDRVVPMPLTRALNLDFPTRGRVLPAGGLVG